MSLRVLLTTFTLALLAPVALADESRTPLNKSTTRNDFTVRIDVQEAQFVHDVCLSVLASVAQRGNTLVQQPPPQNTIHGCSVWNEAERRLDLYVVEPDYVEDEKAFGRIGHELWHGVRGLFHP